MSVEIVNVIATTQIKSRVDLSSLAKQLANAKYEPTIFSGLVYRSPNQPTIIIFGNGKISSHGAKSEAKAKKAIINMVEKINRMGYISNSEIENITIENVVGSANLGKEIDLEDVYAVFPSAIYEPEQFPGLMYRPFNNSVVCLIFSSGKLVIVGTKSEQQVWKTFQTIINIFSKHKLIENVF